MNCSAHKLCRSDKKWPRAVAAHFAGEAVDDSGLASVLLRDQPADLAPEQNGQHDDSLAARVTPRGVRALLRLLSPPRSGPSPSSLSAARAAGGWAGLRAGGGGVCVSDAAPRPRPPPRAQRRPRV